MSPQEVVISLLIVSATVAIMSWVAATVAAERRAKRRDPEGPSKAVRHAAAATTPEESRKYIARLVREMDECQAHGWKTSFKEAMADRLFWQEVLAIQESEAKP